ncbi:helix-turn-helix transcriptional regulator [Streptomyces monashensis]|uniref:helix-turn-helix domain-containing protein n=1 Tax=Streptomyces monashensis TaxID=1678012 RepID=UPI00340506A8
MPSAPPPDWVRNRRRVIGANIRTARLAANLTQEAVALRADTDRPSVVLIEKGERNATIDTLIRIADAIGVPLADLVR